MLVISRRKGESVRLNNVRVTILSASETRVRLGIEAPPEVPVQREEVFQAIERKRNSDPKNDGN